MSCLLLDIGMKLRSETTAALRGVTCTKTTEH